MTSGAQQRQRVVVIGAGAFGGWTALHLLRIGASVTLVDAWGPGNSRSSSGDETRIIRATYGPDKIYVAMTARSRELWRDNERRWNRSLYHKTGVLWMAGPDDSFEKAAITALKDAGIAFEQLSTVAAARRWPQANFEGVNWLIYESDAGYLTARRNCQTVLDGFLKEGGEYREVAAQPGRTAGKALENVTLSDGTELVADQFVFACGPWLGKTFPSLLGGLIAPTRQEVFFFGAPAGDLRFSVEGFPVWIDHGPSPFYGVPGTEGRGFKIGDDTRGAAFDPTTGERLASPEGLRAARAYLAMRFPSLASAPLLETRVCQYENTPDRHFIIDRHPELQNVLLVGGGSGHGYKHGPAVGERAAAIVLGKSPDSFFALSRFEDRRTAA